VSGGWEDRDGTGPDERVLPYEVPAGMVLVPRHDLRVLLDRHDPRPGDIEAADAFAQLATAVGWPA
jgi:hypothetical protein